ncbi:MAG: RNA polymerase sigma factor, partial [Proteobacteria bacterium]
MGTKVADWPQIVNKNASPDFSALYNEHAPTVRRVLARMVNANDLDDLVQDVFLRIYRFQDSFREESDIRTWVHRICVNTVQDHYRKKRWTNLLSFSSEGVDEPQAKEDQGRDTENQNFVEKALHKLSVKERVVVVLFYLEDVSVEEIAVTLKLPEGTIKSRLH